METHEIEFEVGTDGTVRATVTGAKGPGCLEYVKLVEDILRVKGSIEHTHEYYEPPTGVEIHIEESH